MLIATSTACGKLKFNMEVLANERKSTCAYGNGLRLVLQNLSKHILVFETPEAARKKLGKKKPMLWVVTEALTKQPDQPCMCNGLQGIKPFRISHGGRIKEHP